MTVPGGTARKENRVQLSSLQQDHQEEGSVVALLGAPRRRRRSCMAGGTSAKPQATPFKAAWIYVGPHNDAGWSQAHDMGRLYVQKQLGTNVQTTYKENIANGAQLQADGGEPRP